MKAKKILKIILFDILGYAVCMGIFLLFFYLVPYELESDGKVVGDVSAVENSEFKFTTNKDMVQEDHRTSSNSHDKDAGRGTHYDHLGTKDVETDNEEVKDILSTDISSETIGNFENDNTIISVYKKELFEGDDKITYYVADVQVRSLTYLKTALANDKYGINIKEDPMDIAEDNDAILAITGDNYSNNESGIVVRNGVLYRDDGNDADVCVLFVDGTLKAYSSEEFDAEEIWAEGVWQAWCFGPSLLDENGNILSNFTSTTYLSDKHPRVALGYIEPGHYIFMVVDGRDEGYSCGVTLSELATLMYLENCTTAYNLDGGGSASMIFDGEFLNKATDREISDIIYVTP